MAAAFMERVEQILKLENIDYDKAVIAEIIQKHFPDFRRALNELQRYSVNGKIDVGVLTQIADVTLKDLMICLKKNDAQKILTTENKTLWITSKIFA